MELILGILVGMSVSLLGLLVRESWLRRRQLAALREDIAQLELPLMVIEFTHRRLYVNDAVAGRLGLEIPPETSVDQAVAEFVREADQEQVRQSLEELRVGVHGYRDLTFAIKHRDGRWHEIQAQAFRLESSGVRSGLVAVTLEDRTESREVVEERDRLFNLSLDLMAVGDLTGRMLQVNPAWVRVLRWSRDDIMDRTFVDLIHPDDRPQAEAALKELATGLPVRELELRTLARDGSHRWISWSSFPLTARRTVFTVARDITDRKHAEQELAQYQQRLRNLASQLSAVEERERRRLAEILHDTLAQDLFAVQAKLTLLKYPDRVADLATIRDEAAAILDDAADLARTLTFELFPPALYEVGLDAALEWLCRSFRRTRNLPCTFTAHGEPDELAIERRTLLYQGARELLANVVKHAGASHAELHVRYDHDALRLQVDDDGRGVDVAAWFDVRDDGRPGGFGLFNIRERLDQVGGQLGIEPSHLGGARVTLTLPHPAGEA